MNPEPGQYVKILFNNGTAAEGFVHSWSDTKSVLETENQDSFLVIQKTVEDVLAVKIFPSFRRHDEVELEYEEVKEHPRSQMNIKKLAELKVELNRQEREAYFNQVKSHELSQIQPVQYHVLNVPQKRRPQYNPTTQNPRTDIRNYQGLSDVFSGKTKGNR